MITVTEATKYSINNGSWMAWEITYSEGTKVRAVKKSGKIIEVQYKTLKSDWISRKPYIVKHNRKRNGERIIQDVECLLLA